MNTPARITLFAAALLALTASLGCRSPKPIPRHTEDAPGPWEDVKVSIVFTVTDPEVKVTIGVADHPKGSGYVQKFEMFDGKGVSIGHRVFLAIDVPSVTFILDDETSELTVEVTSTQLGKWRSNPRKVPRE